MSQQRGAARTWFTYSREETVQALMELEPIGERLGGGFVLTPIRQRVMICPECQQEMCEHLSNRQVEAIGANDPSNKPLYFTPGWIIKHESFMPAIDPTRNGGQAPPPQPAPPAQAAPALEADAPLTLAELEAHFGPEVAAAVAARDGATPPPAEEVSAALEGDDVILEPVEEGDPTEGLTEAEIAAQREARAQQGDPASAVAGQAVVSAGGDGRAQ